MGEYAMLGREQVKIGTCENMYYLRASQACLVTPCEHSLDPNDPATRLHLRFRFPFPDEDDVSPGSFDPPERGLRIEGVETPAEVEHDRVQFVAGYPSKGGWNVMLPCPLSVAGRGMAIHRNGGPDGVLLRCQKCLPNGLTAIVCSCPACGSMWRVETLEEAAPYVAALTRMAERLETDARQRVCRDDASKAWRGPETDAAAREAGAFPSRGRAAHPGGL